jgi:drug/metabolite transporter (DMT)-like permease
VGALSETQKGLIATVLQTFMAVTSFFIAKDTLAYFRPEPLVLMRSSTAAVILLSLAWLAPGAPAQWKKGDLLRLAALGILAVPMNQGLYFHGLSMTTAAHSALLYALTPALVLLLGRMRGTERLTPARVGGIAAAFAGVVVVLLSRPNDGDAATGVAMRQLAGPDVLRGDLWVLAAVLAWSLYTAYSRDVVARLGTIRATAFPLAIGALLFAPIGIPGALETDFSAVPSHAWIGVAWLAIVASTLSYLAWYYAIRRLTPSRVAIFNNVQPVGAALLAWAMGARPGPALFAGAGLVIFGVVLAQRSRAE